MSNQLEHDTSDRADSYFRLAPYQITLRQYLSEAIVICVYREMQLGRLRMVCVDRTAQQNLERFARAVVSLAPNSERDKLAWATGKVNALLDKSFADDAWYSHAPGFPPVVMLDYYAIAGVMSVEAAVRAVHMVQVCDALLAGLEVPALVKEEYRRPAPVQP